MSVIPYQARKRALYTQFASNYDVGMERIVGVETIQRRVDWLAEVIEPGHRVLDLGCGTGLALPALAEATGPAGLVVGADLCPAMLERAAARTTQLPQSRLLLLDATSRLPFRDEAFDCVCAMGLLQEVAAPRSLLEEAKRILRPGGAFRGLATTYHSLSPAAEVHMAAAEELPMFFRPQNTVATMFMQIFGPAAATRWEHNPALTDAAVWDALSVQPMTQVAQTLRDAGHDPASVELGVLYMTGRRVA
jgi:ubiquinone/menaquinone biosynthesis C-methylase UbiE